MSEATPIILVAGPVVMGRHDVAQAIANHYGVRPTCLAVSASAADYVVAMQPALDRERPVVLDGTWLDGAVLATACKQRRTVSQVQASMLTRLALSRVAPVVVPITSLRTYLSNIAMMSPLDINLLNKAFNVYYEWESLDTCLDVYNINCHAESIRDYLLPMLDKALEVTNLGPGIGEWCVGESILLVGDRHGPSLQPYHVRLNVAFVSMSGVGCSEWLTEQIKRERRLYWVNAYGKDGQETSAEFVSLLRPKAVIALGNAAELWCAKHKLQVSYDVYRVPHPQFWKRFKSAQPYPLREILKSTTV